MIGPVREGGAGDAALVAAALAGSPTAFAALFDGWFDRCFDVAFRIVRNRDIAAEVAQDVFLGAWHKLASLRDPEAFGGWVLRTARNRALNRLEKERRSVALGDEVTTTVADATAAAPDAAEDALAGTAPDLVWAAAAALGERDTSILDLHLRHGMAAPALAAALGVTPNNAHQLLFRLRARLGDAIRSSVLWHDGRPSCPELQDELHRAGLGAFGPEAAKVAGLHAAGCARCGERQRQALAPEALFAGVPLVVAGPELRAKVISSLRDAGVTIGHGDVEAPPAPEAEPAPVALAVEEDAAEARRSGRRAAGLAVVLAVLLLGGGAVAALRRDTTEVGVGVASSVPSSSTAVTAAAVSAPPTSVAPSVAGPTTAPPVTTDPPRPTTSTTAPTTTSTAAVKPPVVVRFAATTVRATGVCPKDARQVLLSWSTTDATAVTVAGPGAPAKELPPNGAAPACAPTATASPTYVLTATGPGGSATAQDPA